VFLAPVIVGDGNPFFPANARVRLKLLDTRGFDNGMVYVRYRATKMNRAG
jgi:dihydrofolate reductase